MPILVHAIGKADLPPLKMPDRFRHEITYFMTPGGEEGVPPLGPAEYWIRIDDSRRCFDEGVVRIVSPLDSDSKAEIELTEEQEGWLEWMLTHAVQHVRVERTGT